MLKSIQLFITTLAAFGIFHFENAAAISLDFVPSSNKVHVGSTVTVDVKISGLGDHAAPSLGAYDLGVEFNPNYLDLPTSGVTDGDPVLGDQLNLSGFGSLTSTTLAVVIDPNTVEVRFAEVSLDTESVLNSQQAGDFILASLTFSGIRGGISPLKFVVHDMSDASNDSAPFAGINLGSASVVVSEPGTAFLISIGVMYPLFGKNRISRKHPAQLKEVVSENGL